MAIQISEIGIHMQINSGINVSNNETAEPTQSIEREKLVDECIRRVMESLSDLEQRTGTRINVTYER